MRAVVECLTVVLFSGVALATGSLAVDIYEYPVPTAAAKPHDPAVGTDGSLWVTEQAANKLGRLDPVTGRFREYPLPTADSGPHGLTADPTGNIWFTANYKGYIGQLNPRTGRVRPYALPAKAKDPHTPVFDRSGALWFTAQEANVIGRLEPTTGAVVVREVPTPNAKPYGIIIGADGAPYFCEFGANKLGRVDPSSLTIREFTLPEGARPRRLALAPDGTIYYSDYARGKLGRVDPKTGRFEEWSSPGGDDSKPYGIAVTADGNVWYSESGVQPNTLVRFDPRTKKLASAPIPSGGGTVRNIAATADGRLFLACSGVNRVAIAVPASLGAHASAAGSDTTAPAEAAPATLSAVDQHFLDDAARASLAEIKLGQLAIEKGTTAPVQQLGKIIVDDHQKVFDRLRAIASGSGVGVATQPTPDQQTAYARLAALKGRDFEKAFLAQTWTDHDEAVTLFQAEAENGRAPQLRSFAKSMLPSLRQHRELAGRPIQKM